VKVAAYQAPILPAGDMLALELIRLQVGRCAALGVEVLCCPEAILGGLADFSSEPQSLGLTHGQVAEQLLPIARPEMTLIVGFSEAGKDGHLFNAAAVVRRGELVGVYHKQHPAIRHSIYSPGGGLPVFDIGICTIGIVICFDSTFPELARGLADLGASVLFVPTNTALPLTRDSNRVVTDARECDVARAIDTGMAVVRADVAGRTSQFSTPGATAITGGDGTLLGAAKPFAPGLVVAEIELSRRSRKRAQGQTAA